MGHWNTIINIPKIKNQKQRFSLFYLFFIHPSISCLSFCFWRFSTENDGFLKWHHPHSSVQESVNLIFNFKLKLVMSYFEPVLTFQVFRHFIFAHEYNSGHFPFVHISCWVVLLEYFLNKTENPVWDHVIIKSEFEIQRKSLRLMVE